METIKITAAAAQHKIDVIALGGDGADLARLTLDSHGLIEDCNRIGEDLFKYSLGTLVGRHVSMLLPQLVEFELLQRGEINPQLRFLCRVGRNFQAVNQHGARFATQLFWNVLDGAGHCQVSLIVRPAQETPDSH
jgi:PAS domain-containing protein